MTVPSRPSQPSDPRETRPGRAGSPRPRPRRSHPGRSLVEQLEGRQLLTFSAVLGGATSTFTVGNTLDSVIFSGSGGNLQHNPLTAPAGQSFFDNFDFDSTLAGSQNLPVSAGSTVALAQGSPTSAYNATIGTPASPASTLLATFTAAGSPGSSLTVDDSGSATANTFARTLGGITGTGVNLVETGGAFGGGINLITGSAQDTINVQSTFGGEPTTLSGSGGDVVDVGDGSTNLLSAIAGALNVQGTNSLLTIRTLSSGSDAATFSSTQVTGLSAAPISYANLGTLSVFGGNGDSTYTLANTPAAPTSLTTGTGTDTVNDQSNSGSLQVVNPGGTDAINIGKAGFLTGIGGPVVVDNTGGSTAIVADGSADNNQAAADLVSLGGGIASLVGFAPSTIEFHTAPNTSLTLDTSTNPGDTQLVDFSGGNPIPSAGLTLNGNGSLALTLENQLPSGPFTNETLNATGSLAGNFSLDGSAIALTGTKTVDDVTPATNLTENYVAATDSRISVTAGPTVNGLATTSVANLANTGQFPVENFANKANVTINAGADNDVVNVAGAAILPGSHILIDGQGGTNVLNYDAGGQTVVITPVVGGAPDEATIARPGSALLTVQNFQTINVTNGQVQGIPAVGPFVTTSSISAFAGVPLVNVEVANFNDAATPNAVASDYGATINWGDGTATAGTIVPDASNPTTFHVQGSHVYATPSPAGGYVLSVTVTQRETNTTALPPVTITQTNTGGSSANATVTEPTIVVAGQTIRGVAGSNLVGQVVATLDPTNPFDTSNGFPPAGTTATINWGDGTTSPGTFVADGGQFDIVGSHAYATFGGFPVVTTITGLGVGYPAALVAQGSAVIADAVLADTTAGSLLAGVTEGVPFSGTFATFTDPNVAATPADFTAIIHYGDGHASPATIIAGSTPGSFVINGTNTYAASGNDSAIITVQDMAAANGSSLTIARPVVVANTSIDPTANDFPATLGTRLTEVVATFTAGSPLASASEFTASVDFGDGTPPTAASVVKGVNGVFDVVASHTYRSPSGPSTPTVATTIDEGGTLSATVTGTATVSAATASGAALSASGIAIQAVAGAPFTGAVATFTYPGGVTPPANLSGTINWGDGTTTTIAPGDVTLLAGSNDIETVAGTHTYLRFGQFTVTTILTGSPGGAQGVASSTATVADAALSQLIPPFSPSFIEGAAGSVSLPFRDANPSATAGDFTASINFGDGQTAPGQVIAQPGLPGQFFFLADHTFAKAGTYQAQVSITDISAPGGSTLSFFQPITVAGASLFGLNAPIVITPIVNQPFNGTLAQFTSANPLATASDFSAAIVFGDGSAPVAGTITEAADGSFFVTASHTYGQSSGLGSEAIVVGIRELSSGESVNVPASAVISDAPLVGQGATITAVAGAPLSQNVVATFTYGGTIPGSDLPFTGTINWGDGVSVPITSANLAALGYSATGRTYVVTGGHTYETFGDFPVTVTLNAAGSTGVASGSAHVADALTVVVPTIATDANGSFSGVVATFAEAGSPGLLSKYAASVNFGDGTPAIPGTIVPGPGGSFEVFATHTFTTTPAFPVSVTVTDDLSGITTGTGSAPVAFTPAPPAPPAPPVALFVAGRLDPASDSGESDADAITNINRPHFLGTASPGAAIFLYATPLGSPIQHLIGSTTADATGSWGITSITLPDGKYGIEAVGIDPTRTVDTLDLILPVATQGSLTIDTVAPKVAYLQFEPLSGSVVATFQDELSGLDRATLADGANFTFTHIGNLPGVKPSAYKAGSPLAPAYVVTGVSVGLAASATSPQAVVISIDNNQPLRGGFYRITIKSGGIEDVAGNALDGTYYGYFPSGKNTPGGDFVANLTSVHNTVLPALPVGTTASPLANPGTRPTSVFIPTVKATRVKVVGPYNSVVALAGQDFAPTTAVAATQVKAHAATRAKPAPHVTVQAHATATHKVHDAALAHLTVKKAARARKA